MAIPTYEECMLPFLSLLDDGQPHRIKDIVLKVSDAFALTPQERAELLPSGQQKIANRVGWARTYLKKAGLISSPQRGLQVITEPGRDVLRQAPPIIDREYLKRFESFVEFIGRKPSDETVGSETPSNELPAVVETPEEIIEAAYEQLQSQLASDLLDNLKNATPYFFEHVVLRLLRAMGYGGLSCNGEVTPRSRDGGIDGVIHEDKLGLDSVCIQAKRWEGTVGRRAVQEFVGSMDLHRSRKGVILTTSRFSAS